jgi:RNA polymerase sigma-70 factor (ECF subfamily)
VNRGETQDGKPFADPAEWPSLMRMAQAGDEQAYARLLRALVPVIRLSVRYRIYDDVLVDDVIQETLMTVHRLRHTYDPSLPMRPWLNAIAHARSIDALRKRGRSSGREVFDDAALDQAADPRAGRVVEKLMADQEIGRLLDILPARQRAVVELVKLREMSLDEAAVESRTSVSAIKALLHRAIETLRKHKSHDHV